MKGNVISCNWCTKALTKKRDDHRFCSDPCRKKWNKKKNGKPALPSFITNRRRNKAPRRQYVGSTNKGTQVSIMSHKTPQTASIQTKINWFENQKIFNRSMTQKGIMAAMSFGLTSLMTDNIFLRLGAVAAPFIIGKSNREIELHNGNLQLQIDELQTQLIELNQVNLIPEVNAPGSTVTVHDNFKMIQAIDIDGLEHDKYLLDEQWRYFLNYLPHSFNAIIYGLPKAGKTHLAIQFAQYLQKKFGNVLYVSGEEGVEEPFNDKLKKYGSSFQVAYDVKGSFGIMKAIEKLRPKFVFIDSLNRLGLKANDIISFKENFPNTVFVYIMQSTKEGSFKGGQDIAHEVTSMINVINGTAHQKGRTVSEPTQIAVFK